MRVGDDVGARWDASKIAKHHGERDTFNGCGEVLRSIAATMNHFYQHKKLWINDPDYLVVRQKGSNSELSYEEAQSWASIVGLSNVLVMLGDKMLELQDSNEKWHVACIINVDYPSREREYTLFFKDIGLDSCKGYHVFDFWESRYQGTFSGNYNVKLQPQCCQVVAIREDWNVPQVLSTDIHISQGGLEIESSKFTNNTLNIKTTDMDRAGNVFILVPEDYTPPKEFAKHSGNVWKCHLKLDGKSKEYGVTRR